MFRVSVVAYIEGVFQALYDKSVVLDLHRIFCICKKNHKIDKISSNRIIIKYYIIFYSYRMSDHT